MSDCIFCNVVAGTIPAKVVARNAHALAFHDLNPQAPVHLLVVPTVHFDNAAATDSDAGQASVGHTMRLAVQAARESGLVDSGYRLVLNTGTDGGQSVGHLHVHVLGGRRMTWPPG